LTRAYNVAIVAGMTDEMFRIIKNYKDRPSGHRLQIGMDMVEDWHAEHLNDLEAEALFRALKRRQERRLESIRRGT
jgi:hypothetical protein